MGGNVVDLIQLAQDRDRLRASLNSKEPFGFMGVWQLLIYLFYC
jgi:hypothetical protein